MDFREEQRQALIDEIGKQLEQGASWYGGPRPAVSLEAFFNANDDIGSIGCNLLDHPGTKQFYLVLDNIRRRTDVKDVLVGINSVEEPEPGGHWPFSDSVYILTSAQLDEVKKWVVKLEPTEVESDPHGELAPNVEIPPQPFKIVLLMWD